MSPPRINMLTSGPLRPSLRVGTGGEPAGELLPASGAASTAFAARAGVKATPTGAIMALRRKLRRVRVDFLAFIYSLDLEVAVKRSNVRRGGRFQDNRS